MQIVISVEAVKWTMYAVGAIATTVLTISRLKSWARNANNRRIQAEKEIDEQVNLEYQEAIKYEKLHLPGEWFGLYQRLCDTDSASTQRLLIQSFIGNGCVLPVISPEGYNLIRGDMFSKYEKYNYKPDLSSPVDILRDGTTNFLVRHIRDYIKYETNSK